MLFNSTLYIVFLTTVVWLFYQLTPYYRRILILLASYTFYWVWSIPFSLLLIGSTFIDYYAAILISRSATPLTRRLGLLFSLVFNLGVLCLFKYFNFFSDSIYSIVGARVVPELNLVLPLGISFYTFQTMSYTIDVFRGHIKVRKSLMDVAIYVSFFPQLVAGPIVRSDVLIPQLECSKTTINWENIRKGTGLIVWGLCKKVFVADSMGHIANEIYNSPGLYGGVDLILGTYAFAVQIYCDFSAYSDIAIGSALLLGIHLPINFNKPYLAISIQDFWQRWHISLSTWLKDYLYIPLGGNRKGISRTYLNLMITMLLGGLWHGAGWNWVFWGGFHGAILSFERIVKLPNQSQSKFVTLVRWLITMQLVMISWVFFRANDVQQAFLILKRIVTFADGLYSNTLPAIFCFIVIVVSEKLKIREIWLKYCNSNPRQLKWITYASIIVLIFTFAGVKNPEFIYFQF